LETSLSLAPAPEASRMPYRPFDKVWRVAETAVMENKRLGVSSH
jgi:hypothetical protein